jgi:uncharacterized protein
MRFLPMGRIFLVLVLLAVSLYIVKYIRTKLDKPPEALNKDDQTTEDSNKNKVVKCQHCGLHIPDDEAIKQGDKTFCSLEHAKEEL